VPVDAVIFDLDGVLIDSEQVWDDVRQAYVRERGGTWLPGADRQMMGMSTQEWSAYLHDELGVASTPDAIAVDVIAEMGRRYGASPPVLPGATEAVRRLAGRWPLGLASSSPARLIEAVLEALEVRPLFQVVLSSELVERGKPAPDVYLAVAERLGVAPGRCAAIEDSTNGLRAATAAGMRVVAVPNRAFPPDPTAVASADAVVESLDDLTEAVVDPSTDGP
jgi:HAD superfamily hydrolase (TIGR01509 family)